MSHRVISLLLAGLLLPGVAHAAGAAGAFFESQYLPRYGPRTSPHEAPGWVGCVGGTGYGVTSRGLRIGGEGAWCSGSDGQVQVSYGGAQIGRWVKAGWPYFSFYGSLGFGALVDGKVETFQDEPYAAIFFYGRPTLAMGLPLGFFSAEFGLYANVPFNLVQSVGTGDPRGFVTPTVGLSVSLMFGNFKAPRKPDEVRPAPYPTRAYPPPPPYPPPAGPPPIVSPYETIPEVPPGCAGDARGPDCPPPVLAIPVD